MIKKKKIDRHDTDEERTILFHGMELCVTFEVWNPIISNDDIGERGWIPQYFLEEYEIRNLKVVSNRRNDALVTPSKRVSDALMEELYSDEKLTESLFDGMNERASEQYED
jgi:hypothetical protein